MGNQRAPTGCHTPIASAAFSPVIPSTAASILPVFPGTPPQLKVLRRRVESAHYRWPGWLARIGDAGLTRSMSRKGRSPDNAACESFFGRLKTAVLSSTVGSHHDRTVDSRARSSPPLSTGTTKRESRSPLALSARSNTERASESRHNPVQDFVRISGGSLLLRR